MRKNRKRMTIFSYLFIIIVLFIAFLWFLEFRIMPPLKEISHMKCKSVANTIINEAALMNIDQLDCSALLIEKEDHFVTNTSLVNRFCANLSQDITDELKKISSERILIPMGAVTGFSLFSNTGPDIPFTLIPMGNAKVDYETAFSSAGINQINYKIWLHISIESKIVNPLYQETVFLERKIMLADLIFSGKVPEHYFQISQPNEYLLTE